jgi:hypothetical protein
LIGSAAWFVFLLNQTGSAVARPAREGVVELKVVKYNGLVEALRSQRGKVVVVDIWGEF